MSSIPDLADCEPGFRATGFAMVVAVAPVPEKQGSVFIPDSAREKDKLIGVRGRVVSMSPACFDFAAFPEGATPVVGDAVQFARLAGTMTTGADGKEYRIIADKDVLAIIEEA